MESYNKATRLLLVLLVCLGLTIAGCEKLDTEYRNYLQDREIIYPGSPSAISYNSGYKRVKLRWTPSPDPSVSRYVVYYNYNQDSVIFNVPPGQAAKFTGGEINNLKEGTYFFKIYTYDADNNRSKPVELNNVKVYGDYYANGLVNRPVTSAAYTVNGILIRWADVNSSSGILKMQIKYTDKLNNMHDTLITSFSTLQESSLPNYKIGSSFSYRTSYLPSPTAIDTFYVDYQTHTAIDATILYLRNVGPFTRATLSGRWGTLAAPWVTNAAAKNKGGINGGYTADNGGAINWETYGNTPVTNGIVYQATSLPLPAGKYIVAFDEYSEIQTNSSVYCVVAAGGNGIPILANLSTALGYQALYNGAVINTSAPNRTDTRSVEFTLATSQVVSIGFLGNLAANNYFRVSAIRLFTN